MTKQLKEIEIPFGAKDSELCDWECTIPEGMEATIVDNKIVVKKKESEDEKIRKWLIRTLKALNSSGVEVDGAYEMMLPTITWLEKQVEQKSTKKIVPKHEVGDWVVSPNGVYWHIDAIQDGRYQVSSDSGDSADWPLSTNIYHRFTIKDAKDGDVLYSLDSNQPFLYKSRKAYEQAIAYCGINKLGKFFVWDTKDGIITLDKYIPATKEQRESLMKAMNDAGYTFDFEKKELKEIEQNLAWSEEDENGLGDTLWAIKQARTIAKDENDMGNLWYAERWLKSLKDRFGCEVNCTTTKAWSEEDEGFLDSALWHIQNSITNGNIKAFVECPLSTWLKSIKDRIQPQNAWKPSDEQMKVLSKYAEQNNYDGSVLTALYQELKKLKGE